jgi:hypothetical protein
MLFGNFSQTFAFGRKGAAAASPFPAPSYPGVLGLRYDPQETGGQVGTTIYNVAGNGVTCNGTLQGVSIATVTLAGVSRKVFDFNNASGGPYITMGNYTFTSDLCFMGWFKPNARNNIMCVMANAGSNTYTNGFKFDINNWQSNDRAMVAEIGNGSTGAGYTTAPGIVNTNVWQHLVWCFDSQSKFLYCSVDGVQKGIPYLDTVANRQAVSAPTNIATPSSWEIGRIVGASHYGYYGQMSDLRVYSGVLTPQQITDHYTTTRSIYGV